MAGARPAIALGYNECIQSDGAETGQFPEMRVSSHFDNAICVSLGPFPERGVEDATICPRVSANQGITFQRLPDQLIQEIIGLVEGTIGLGVGSTVSRAHPTRSKARHIAESP